MSERGRPTDYAPELCGQVVDLMATGLSLTAAAAEIGVHRDTIYAWEAKYPEFSDAIKIARGKRVLKLEQDLLTATEGPRVTARIFALKNADAHEWRDKREVEHSGEMNITTKEQRDAAVAAATRADR